MLYQVIKVLFIQLILFMAVQTDSYGLNFNKENGTHSSYYMGLREEITSVGQKFNWAITNNLALFTDFESQMAAYHGDSFQPSRINYGIGLRYKNIAWEHQCLHDIDTYRNTAYPKKNKISFYW